MAETKDVKKKNLANKTKRAIAKDLILALAITAVLMVASSTAIGLLSLLFGVTDPRVIGMLGFFNGFFIYVVYLRVKLVQAIQTNYKKYVEGLKEIENEKS